MHMRVTLECVCCCVYVHVNVYVHACASGRKMPTCFANTQSHTSIYRSPSLHACHTALFNLVLKIKLGAGCNQRVCYLRGCHHQRRLPILQAAVYYQILKFVVPAWARARVEHRYATAICKCVCACAHIYTAYTCICIRMYEYICNKHMYTCMHKCKYTCMYNTCIHICVTYICIYICKRTCERERVCLYVSVCVYTGIHM